MGCFKPPYELRAAAPNVPVRARMAGFASRDAFFADRRAVAFRRRAAGRFGELLGLAAVPLSDLAAASLSGLAAIPLSGLAIFSPESGLVERRVNAWGGKTAVQ